MDLKLIEGQPISCKITNLEIDDAKLHFENGSWYICQDEKEGTSCIDKLGYKYSYKLCDNPTETSLATMLVQITEYKEITWENLRKGDRLSNGGVNSEFVVLARLEDIVFLSMVDNHERLAGGRHIKELIRDFRIIQPSQSKKSQIREMTVKEISKELGFEIKVIKE